MLDTMRGAAHLSGAEAVLSPRSGAKRGVRKSPTTFPANKTPPMEYSTRSPDFESGGVGGVEVPPQMGGAQSENLKLFDSKLFASPRMPDHDEEHSAAATATAAVMASNIAQVCVYVCVMCTQTSI